MTRISIAMATYNGSAYIREQLDSFAQQSRLPDELVVTDDGSSDETAELVSAFAETAPFEVRFHRNPQRLGYSLNFGRAASLCTGDLVSFSDQDDSWYPEKVATVLEVFAGEPSVQFVVNDQDITVSGLQPSGATTLGNIRKLGYRDAYLVSGCCTTVRRSFLELLLPFPKTVAYDHWCGRMADLLGIGRIVEQSLQAFRRHGANTSDDVLAETSPSMLSTIRKYGLREAHDGWRQELASNRTYIERLTDRREVAASLVCRQRVDDAISSLRSDIDWLDERMELTGLPRTRRAARVISLWVSGFYDRHFGWKSAVKDLLRP